LQNEGENRNFFHTKFAVFIRGHQIVTLTLPENAILNVISRSNYFFLMGWCIFCYGNRKSIPF
ncbi:hypothetical protein C0J52_25849, partial [Blattella germanica]